ncbi:MAG: CapA family protein [Oscillospiraceae bacterium]|nr:CapA family protein [Oscillospiraceae bacterium]
MGNCEVDMTMDSKDSRPICMVFSADKNAVIYSCGDINRKLCGGLGLPLLLYHFLTLINKGALLWSDKVTVSGKAAKESNSVNSLGLVKGEKVSLFTLFCAAAAINAPDAIITIGGHIFNSVGKKKNSTVAKLRQIGDGWGIPNESIKNLTGRFYEQNPQYFTVELLSRVAAELLAFDVENNLNKNRVVHNETYVECESVLGSTRNIMRYLCFGDEFAFHAIAMAEYENETLFISVGDARTPLERDTAILNALFCINEKSCIDLNKNTDTWINVSQNILTICGDTYCGERYTKWRIKRGIDDPIQRYGDEGYDFSFENVKQFITKESFNIVNSECVLSPVYDKSQQTGKYLGFVLGANPEKTVNCYKRMNINAVMLANNHMMDFDSVGCRQTKRYFEQAGILTVGTGTNIRDAETPVCLKINGHRVIIFNAYGYYLEKRHKLFRHYCLGENTGAAFITDIIENCSFIKRIEQYRKEYPEAFIILSPHWGKDFDGRHLHLRAIAQRAIKAGVDLIVGHGPHIPIGAEHLSKKIVIYSLGNFVFNTTGIDLDASGKLPYGIISQLYFDKKAVTLRLYPIYAHNMNTFFQPKPVDEKQLDEFLKNFIGAKKFKIKKDELGYYLQRGI